MALFLYWSIAQHACKLNSIEFNVFLDISQKGRYKISKGPFIIYGQGVEILISEATEIVPPR